MRSKCATSLLCSPPYFNNCLSLQQFVRRSSGASKAFSTRSAGCRSWTRRSGTSASRRSSRRRRDQRRRRPQVRRPKTPSPTPPPRPSSTSTSRTPERLSWKSFSSLGIISSRLFRYKFWTPLLILPLPACLLFRFSDRAILQSYPCYSMALMRGGHQYNPGYTLALICLGPV